MIKTVKVALIYDFDETLSMRYMQDYLLIPEFGMKPSTFWKNANKWSFDNQVDQITGSLYYIKKTAQDKGVSLTKEKFGQMGKTIEYYEGVLEWFDRINEYGKELDLEIEHYIISAGIESIIEEIGRAHV